MSFTEKFANNRISGASGSVFSVCVCVLEEVVGTGY